MIEIDRMCQYATDKAQPKSTHYCARFVRFAVNFGFDDLIKAKKKEPLQIVANAKDSGDAYEKFGFKKIFDSAQPRNQYQPQKGDIAIIHYEPSGHICINTKGNPIDKDGWISDFAQRDMFGSSQRDKNPYFEIRRYS